uniref:DRBM domain-containing protein n=1 Tax=Globodera pallida TaxID=36090 RepID=A0A183BPU9_GLOPA
MAHICQPIGRQTPRQIGAFPLKEYPVTQPPATTNNICLSAFLFGVTEGTDVDVGRAETVSLAQQLATQYGW